MGEADPLQVELHHLRRSTLRTAGDLAGYGEQQDVRAKVRLCFKPGPQTADDFRVQDLRILPLALAVGGGYRGGG